MPASQRKLTKDHIEKLAQLAVAHTSPRVVTSPRREYDRDWDWIVSEDGMCLNWAGCMEGEEINRREDEGVQRAMELIAAFVERDEPVTLALQLLTQVHALNKQVHVELMGTIYPFAGSWHTVALHKGEGPTKWPLPPGGIQPLLGVLERHVLVRSPCISDHQEVFDYASEVTNQILAIHPFREGNGRTAVLVGSLILTLSDMLPLSAYKRRTDEDRYYTRVRRGTNQQGLSATRSAAGRVVGSGNYAVEQDQWIANGRSIYAAFLRSRTCSAT